MAQITEPTQSVTLAPATTAATKPAVAADRPGVRRSTWAPYLFLGIPIFLYLLWVIGPMFYTFYMSLTDTDGLSSGSFVGFDNFDRLFGDRIFWTSFWNNVAWLLAYIIIPPLCGLGLALLLNNNLPGVRWMKAGFFSPLVLSSVVVANVWNWMYFPTDGLLNSTINALGYDGQNVAWMAEYEWDGLPVRLLSQIPGLGWFDSLNLVTGSIIAAGMWRQIGYVMLIYLAGLKNVDPSLVDASKTDGASAFQSFRDVVIPQLQPVTVIVVVISIIDALRAFDLVNLMTRGGPANHSNVLANMMYIEAFNNYQMGYGAAVAVILGLMSMLFIFPYLRYQIKNEMEY